MNEFDLDTPSPVAVSKPEPTRVEVRKRLEATLRDRKGRSKELNNSGESLELGDVFAGVSPTWLHHVFNMRIETVKKKLAEGGLEPMKHDRNGVPLYNLKLAAAYLIKPKVNIEQYIRSMGPADLPPKLQADFWTAQNGRLKYEENAGDLWRTAKVAEVMSGALKTIKSTVQLWTDTLDRKSPLSDEQRKFLVEASDKLLEEIYKKLTLLQAENTTESVLSESLDG